LATRSTTQAKLANRTANLTLLILENLVHNAFKVTPAGRAVRVEFEPAPEGGVRCLVADEGPGMPAAMIPRLFMPCPSTHGGSGLGLAISKQLANQLGARLELKSTSPAGCRFALTLPSHLFESGAARSANAVRPETPAHQAIP
jgi:two-component system phosphate regulon sensor histidine kinase PhoR